MFPGSSFSWRFACFFGLVLSLLPPLEGGELDFFSLSPSLVAFARLSSLQTVDQRIEGILQEMGARGLSSGLLRRKLGESLHNPELQGIRTDQGIEFAYFHRAEKEAHPWVIALPIEDAGSYRAFLSEQGVGVEEGSDGILQCFAMGGGGPPFYLALPHSEMLLWGRDRNTVATARRLYEMLPQERRSSSEDVRIFFHTLRWFEPRSDAFQTSLLHLREDLLQNLDPESLASHTSFIALWDAARELAFRLLKQFEILRLSLSFEEERIVLEASVSLAPSGSMYELLREAQEGSPDLAGMLPEGCVSAQCTHFHPAGWCAMMEGIGTILGAALDASTSATLAPLLLAFLKEVEAAGPLTTVSGLLPPPRSALGIGPTLLALIRFASKDRLRSLPDAWEKLCKHPTVIHALQQQGIRLTLDRTPGYQKIAATPVERISLRWEVASGEIKIPGAGLLGRSRLYFLAQYDDILLIAAGRGELRPADQTAAEAFRLDALTQILAALSAPQAESLGKTPGFQLARTMAGEPILHWGMMRPAEYLRTALLDAGSRFEGGEEAQKSLPKLIEAESSTFPSVCRIRKEGEGLHLRLATTRRALRDLLSLIEVSRPAEARRQAP